MVVHKQYCSINVNKIEKLKAWVLSIDGQHTKSDALGVIGIWVDPANGYVSVRKDFVAELVQDNERMYSLLSESRKHGGRW